MMISKHHVVVGVVAADVVVIATASQTYTDTMHRCIDKLNIHDQT
jgi:hypothetical protein